MLHAVIQRGCRGHQPRQGNGKHTVDVVQPDKLNLLAPQGTVHEAEEEHSQHQKERQGMGVAEQVDATGDGVYGDDVRQQLAFGNPSDGFLVAGHFHPHRVAFHFFTGGNLGYHQFISFPYRNGIEQRELMKPKRVGRDPEIAVQSIRTFPDHLHHRIVRISFSCGRQGSAVMAGRHAQQQTNHP